MYSGETTNSSVLDKPLHLLTEDEISQLTREDCRRYLKQKGMRRPSWNKSQAIQQVISLKSLLEPTPSKLAFRPPTTTTVASNSSSSVKELSPADNDAPMSPFAEDGDLNLPPDPSASDAATDSQCPPLVGDANSMLVSRRTDSPVLPIGQMTIFYSGKVNVYDGVPVNKQARALMHVAASPVQFCQNETSSGNSTCSPGQLPPSNAQINVTTQDIATLQAVVTDVEGQSNRQVSLQRYFEKRKDRGKFKVKRKVGSSSSGLEMYLSHQMRTSVIDGKITQCNSSSQSQLGIPTTVQGLIDKQPNNPRLSVDLNDRAAA